MPTEDNPSKPVLTRINEEDLFCPFCKAHLVELASSTKQECEHQVCEFAWQEGGDLESTSAQVQEWWEKKYEEDEDAHPRDFIECPLLDHVVLHTVDGFECIVGFVDEPKRSS